MNDKKVLITTIENLTTFDIPYIRSVNKGQKRSSLNYK